MSRRSHKNYRRCGSRITFFGTFPANPYPGQMGIAPKYPLVASLPVTVVNGQSWRISEVGQPYGREYLGVGGVWVPQDSVTMARWRYKKCAKFNGNTSCIYSNSATYSKNADAVLEFGVVLDQASEVRWEKLITSYPSNVGGALMVGCKGGEPYALHLEVVNGGAFDFDGFFVDGYAFYKIVLTRISDAQTNIKLYRDGVLLTITATNFSLNTLSDGFYIGGGDNPFNDLLSLVKLTGLEGTLIWDAETISGSSIPDLSGNGNDGTVVDVTPQYAWVLQ